MFWRGVIPKALNLKMDGVKIGFPLSPTLDCHQTGPFQFADQLSYSHPAHAHVLGQSVLAGKTKFVVPRVAQKHGVGDLGSRRNYRVFQNEIRDLGKASLQHGILRVELQVPLLEDFPDCLHLCYDYVTSAGGNNHVDSRTPPSTFMEANQQSDHRRHTESEKAAQDSDNFGTVPKSSAAVGS